MMINCIGLQNCLINLPLLGGFKTDRPGGAKHKISKSALAKWSVHPVADYHKIMVLVNPS